MTSSKSLNVPVSIKMQTESAIHESFGGESAVYHQDVGRRREGKPALQQRGAGLAASLVQLLRQLLVQLRMQPLLAQEPRVPVC